MDVVTVRGVHYGQNVPVRNMDEKSKYAMTLKE